MRLFILSKEAQIMVSEIKTCTKQKQGIAKINEPK
jgi:hypothetical protein